MDRWREVALWVLVALAALLLFAFGYLVGAGRALDAMRQQAVDQGYAVRDADGSWRWKQSGDWKRAPR